MDVKGFRRDLEVLINKHSMENGSGTPDFVLADYLMDCINIYNATITKREKWYGRPHNINSTHIDLDKRSTPPNPLWFCSLGGRAR